MEKFFETVKTLRNKCPWDREQTLKSLIEQAIEEVYELNSAVLKDNIDGVIEEMGDVLLTLFMMSAILDEKGIKFDKVIEKVHNKIISRHPHVFGDEDVKTAEEVLTRWEKRKGKPWSVEKTLPALLRSSKIQKKASIKGFDWEEISGVYEKIKEELLELKKAKKKSEMEEELGDILFACAHLGNFLGINPEVALQMANNKIEKRFRLLEETLQGRDIKEFSIDELEKIWKKIKK
jgi:tetrapyrrole methylase family protein/MazG family protein